MTTTIVILLISASLVVGIVIGWICGNQWAESCYQPVVNRLVDTLHAVGVEHNQEVDYGKLIESIIEPVKDRE